MALGQGTITLKSWFMRMLAMVNYGETSTLRQQRKTLKAIKENRADWLAYFGIKEWE